MPKNEENTKRILIVDDNQAIHEDFKTIFHRNSNPDSIDMDDLEQELFGESQSNEKSKICYELNFAQQGQEALEMTEQAQSEGRPYAVVFMDVRMPPGWDGVQTVEKIWQNTPDIEAVICTAYSDYSWEALQTRLGLKDNLLFLRKPFDSSAVQQLAMSLTHKWALSQQLKENTSTLSISAQKITQADWQRAIQPIRQWAKLLAKNTPLSSEITSSALQECGDHLQALGEYELGLHPELPQQTWHLEEIVESVRLISLADFHHKNLQLTIQLAQSELPKQQTNPTVIKQLLLHLLALALPFTASGELELRLQLQGKILQVWLAGLGLQFTAEAKKIINTTNQPIRTEKNLAEIAYYHGLIQQLGGTVQINTEAENASDTLQLCVDLAALA